MTPLRHCVVPLLALGAVLSFGTAIADRADFLYVSAAWGGVHVGSARIEGATLVMTLDLFVRKPTQVDSAVCITGAGAQTANGDIVVSLTRGLCGSGALKPSLSVLLPKPAAGHYDVRYQDPSVGNPVIGELDVP